MSVAKDLANRWINMVLNYRSREVFNCLVEGISTLQMKNPPTKFFFFTFSFTSWPGVYGYESRPIPFYLKFCPTVAMFAARQLVGWIICNEIGSTQKNLPFLCWIVFILNRFSSALKISQPLKLCIWNRNREKVF